MDKNTKTEIERRKIHGANLQVAGIVAYVLIGFLTFGYFGNKHA